MGYRALTRGNFSEILEHLSFWLHLSASPSLSKLHRRRSKWDICGPLHFVALHFSKHVGRPHGGRETWRGVVCQAVIAVLNLLVHLVCKKCIVSPPLSLSIPQHRLSSFIRLPQPPPSSDDMLSLMAMAPLPSSLPPCPHVLRREWPRPSSLDRHFFAPFCRAAVAAISSRLRLRPRSALML